MDEIDTSDRPDSTEEPWFEAAIVLGVVVLLVVVATALTTALAGVMTPDAVGGLSLVGTGLLGAAIFRNRALPRVRWNADGPAVGAILVTLGFTLLSMRYAAEHLLTDRDPGVYITTARWLATSGTLLVDGAVGAFAGVEGVDGVSSGYYAAHVDGLLYAQFQHGLAAILAVGHWVGGDWLLLKIVGALSGAVVAAFFAFSRTVLRPWWALAATIGIAVNLVVLHFGRDAYSEILLMIFLYGGLWLLDRALATGAPRRSFLAGLVLGGTAMVRIDAWLILAGLFAFLFFDVWSAEEDWRHRARSVAAPFIAGMALTAGLGVIDLLVASPRYLSDLTPNLYRLGALLAIVIGVGFLASVTTRPWRWIGSVAVAPRRRLVGTAVAALVVVGSALLYFVRPAILVDRSSAAFELIEYLQTVQGVPLDGSRTYWEMSMQWQGWYLGVVGLAVGVVGWAWATRQVIIGRRHRLAPFLFVFSVVTVAFLLRPANSPDHLWMMRRFLPITIPGFILFGFVGVEQLTSTLKERWGRAVAVIAATGLVGAILIPPAAFTAPLARSTTQVGMYGTTRDLCAALGDKSAVLVVSKRLHAVYEPALRAFCEVPAAGSARLPTLQTLRDVNSGWVASGRELYVAAIPMNACEVAPVFSRFIWYPMPERTLTRRPVGEVDDRFGIAIYRASDFLNRDHRVWADCIDPQE